MRKILLTGGRPTGKLHLGHYTGAFKEFCEINYEFDSFCIISDLHMLTTAANHISIKNIWQNAINMIIDIIGMGADPANVNFYLQSNIPEMTYIYTLIQNFISVNDIKEIPSLVHTIEEMQQNGKNQDISLGLLAYPVMEAADIIGMQADLVTIGKDNIDHLKITNQLIDNINDELNGISLKKVSWLTTDNNYILGLDGKKKMSKSLNNCIYISDTRDLIIQKIQSIKWRNESNVIKDYMKIFAPTIFDSITDNYLMTEKELKEILIEELWKIIKEMQEKTKPFLEDRKKVEILLMKGTELARDRAKRTLCEIKHYIGYDYKHCIYANKSELV